MPEYNLGTASGTVKITSDTKGVDQAKAAIVGLDRQQQTSAKTAGYYTDAQGRLRTETGRFASSAQKAQYAQEQLGKSTDQTTESTEKSKRSYEGARVAIGLVGAGVATAGTAIVGALGSAVNTAANFEAGLSDIKAVSGATAGQMDLIRAAALRIGSETSFSASQAADAISELSKAGVSVKDILGGAADATVALAAAGGVDLPEAATIASNAMNQFELSAKELPKIADLIAGAANASAIDVSQFGYSLSQAGAVAKLAGVPFEDLTVAVAELGNAGIVGSDAGTSLKTAFSRLNPTTKATRDAMRDLGLYGFDTGKALKYLDDNGVKPASESQADLEKALRQTVKTQLGSGASAAQVEKAYRSLTDGTKISTSAFYDQQGNLKPLKDVQEILRKSLVGLTADQKQAALGTIFGADAIRAAAVLAGNGAAGYDKLSAAINKTKAADVAKTRLDNLNGAVETLRGSIETAAINIGSVLLPVLRTIVDGVTGLVNAFTSLPAPVQGVIGVVGAVAGVLAVVGGALVAAAAFVAPLVTALGGLSGIAGIIGGALAAITGPVGIAVAAIVAIGVALTAFFTQTDVGRSILGGFVSYIQTAFQNVANFVGPILTTVGDVVGDMVARFRTGFGQVNAAVGQFVSFFQANVAPVVAPIFDQIVSAVSGFVTGVVSGFNGVRDAVLPVITDIANTVGPVLSDAFTFVSGKIQEFTVFAQKTFTDLQPQIQPFVDFFVNTVGPNIGGILQGLGVAFGVVAAVIGVALIAPLAIAAAAVAAFVAVIVGVVAAVTTTVTALTTAAGFIRNVFATAFVAVAGIVSGALNTVVGVVTGVLNTIRSVVTSGLNAVRGVFQTVFAAVAPPVSSALNSVRLIISSVISVVRSLVQAGLFYVRQVFQTVFGALAGIVGPPLNAVRSTVVNGINTVRSGVQAGLNAVRTVFSTVFGALAGIVSGPINTVRSVVTAGVNGARNAVSSAFNSARSTVASVMSAISGAVSTGIGKVVGFFSGLSGKITGALSGIAGVAFRAGASIVGQLVSGLLSGLGRIASAAAQIANKVQAALPNSPAKEGPFSGSGWTAVKTSGTAIANQFASGLTAGTDAVTSATRGVAEAAAGLGSAAAAAARTALGVRSPSTVFAEIGKYLVQGFRDGITGNADQVSDAMLKLSEDLKAKFASIGADSKAAGERLSDLNRQLRDLDAPRKPDGKASAAAKAAYARALDTYKERKAALQDSIKDQRVLVSELTRLGSEKVESKVTALLARDNARLQAIAGQREDVADRLKDAQSSLADVLKSRDDLNLSVTQAVTGLGDVTDNQPATFKAITDRLAATVASTRKFTSELADLRKAGLNDTTYRQLLADFQQSGSTSTVDLLAGQGAAGVAQLNDLQNQLSVAAASLGDQTSTALYQAGVNAAQGLVDGLQSQADALAAAGQRIADALVTAVKAQLGIKSPSTVFRDQVGAQVPAGIAVGILGSASTAVAAARGLVGSVLGSVKDLPALGTGLQVGAGVGQYGTAVRGMVGGVSSVSNVAGATQSVTYNDYSRGDGAIGDEDRLRRALVRSRVLVGGWA